MKRAALMALAVVGLGSCQLVTVPRNACFAGEPCAHGAGGPGGGAGGGSGGQGGGADAGVDAGPEVPNLFRDAGICEDWACVTAKLQPPGVVPPSFQRIDIPVAAPLPDPSCGPNWSGGVLLPDGRVLAMPACADHFLLIDVAARRADLVGPALISLGAPLFLSGVLGCDERVYAMPAFQSVVARITVTPGSLNVDAAFFDLGTEAAMYGAVVAQSCDQGLVVVGPGFDFLHSDYLYGDRVHIRENGAELTRVPIMKAERLFGGAARLGDDSVLLGAAESSGGNTHFAFTRFDPADGGFALVWAVDPQSSSNVTAAGLTVTGAGGAAYFDLTGYGYEVVLDAGAPNGLSEATLETTLAPQQPTRWAAARGDGFIYAGGASVFAVSDRDGTRVPLADQLFDAGSQGSMEGLVVTFDGSLVGIPGSDSTVRLFVKQNGGGLVAPPEVLLSPFFDKL